MIKKTGVVLMLAALLGIAIGAIGGYAVGSQKPRIARTELINADMLEFKGKEVRMYTTEIAPGVMTPRHKHPGVYLVYVLEGSGNLDQDGKTTISLRPGVSYFIDAADAQGSWHSVWNTDNEKPLKSLSVLITDKGQPGTIFDK